MRHEAREMGGKSALRASVLSARESVAAATWEHEDRARLIHVLERLPRPGGTLALYASRPGEPGTDDLIDEVVRAGWTVLLPVLRRQPDWAYFTSWEEMRESWGGIREPSGARLGIGALAEADLILVPCLSVGRDGSRLGTGGGWYDRALPHRRHGVPVVAIAREAELLPGVPVEPHDVMVDAAVTETGWLDL